jgi:predicted ribosome quality control (RQC) complex YloA/Tae2 family protein
MSLPFDPLVDKIEEIFDDQTEWRRNALRVIEYQQREIELLKQQVEKRDKIIEQQEDLLDRLERIRDIKRKWYAVF